jgi:hypothetical protein
MYYELAVLEGNQQGEMVGRVAAVHFDGQNLGANGVVKPGRVENVVDGACL